MTISKPQAILFDLDGTLADSAHDLADAVNILLSRNGKSTMNFEAIRPVVSKGTPGMLNVAFGVTPDDDEFEPLKAEFLAIYNDNICSKTTLFEPLADLLALLAQHHIKWGIVTNKPEFLTQKLLPKLHFPSTPAVIISGDTFSEKKPSPLPLLEAAKAIEVKPSNCWYVGDDERDMQAASAAGMTAVAALWGYIPLDDNPKKWPYDYQFKTAQSLYDQLLSLIDA